MINLEYGLSSRLFYRKMLTIADGQANVHKNASIFVKCIKILTFLSIMCASTALWVVVSILIKKVVDLKPLRV